MNILLFDMGAFTHNDLVYFLTQAGHHCKTIPYKITNPTNDDFFEYRFEKYLLEGSYDCVMSINFHPLVARVCHDNNTKYISWSYDSPISKDHGEFYTYSTNYIFLFDRDETEYFRSRGYDRFYHMPLAVNIKRPSALNVTKLEREAYSCDVSFLGQFYKSPLKDLMYLLDDYDKGLIQAIADAQLHVYGCNFVEECVTPELIQRMIDCYAKHNLTIYGSDSTGLSPAMLVHSINKEVTHTERLVLLSLLSKRYDVTYYSNEQPEVLKNVPYGGTAHYYSEMPKIFNLSKINLNITLRSIHSGIPLRALDIMSCHGFLLSNYQPEFLDFFTPDENIVLYEDIPDALMKVDYYLQHEEKRAQIIQRSLEVLSESFNYPSRLKEMFSIANLL